MVAEDVKTLIDTEWDAARAAVLSLTQTSYVFMKTSPHASDIDPPRRVAGNVTLVIREDRDDSIQTHYGSDLRRYEGQVIAYGISYANMKTTRDELKKIFEENTTGRLVYMQPEIKGDIDETSFFFIQDYEWIKIVTRN